MSSVVEMVNALVADGDTVEKYIYCSLYFSNELVSHTTLITYTTFSLSMFPRNTSVPRAEQRCSDMKSIK
jgi:hypothetical protein